MSLARWFSIPPTVLLIYGCGVTLGARHVTTGDGTKPSPSVVPGNGIVYALPKTNFEVVQPLNLKIPTSGALQGVFDTCRRSCDANGNVTIKEACSFSIEQPKVSFLAPEVRTVTAPDYSRLYQVNPSADMFQTLDFKFDISALGILEKADVSATNTTYEMISSVLATAVKVVGLAKTSTVQELGQQKSTTATARDCYTISKAVDALVKPGQESYLLECGLVREIQSCTGPHEKLVEDERSALRSLFDQAAVSKLDSKLLLAIAANRRERIDAAISKRDEVSSLYGLGESAATLAAYRVTVPIPGPAELTSDSQFVSLGKSVSTGDAKIAVASDNGGDLLGVVTGMLKQQTMTYGVATTVPTEIEIKKQNDAQILDQGFRYRVPTSAPTTLTVYDREELAQRKVLFGPVTDRKVIAQFGPIAALPSYFKGKSGKVVVKLWPDSGGIQTVEIGADAIPTSTVTNVVDEAFMQYKARKDKADAAATAAAAVDVELANLKRQQELLTLKKQIKELEDALKN